MVPGSPTGPLPLVRKRRAYWPRVYIRPPWKRKPPPYWSVRCCRPASVAWRTSYREVPCLRRCRATVYAAAATAAAAAAAAAAARSRAAKFPIASQRHIVWPLVALDSPRFAPGLALCSSSVTSG